MQDPHPRLHPPPSATSNFSEQMSQFREDASVMEKKEIKDKYISSSVVVAAIVVVAIATANVIVVVVTTVGSEGSGSRWRRKRRGRRKG